MAYRVDLANLELVGLGGFYYDFEYISLKFERVIALIISYLI